ncbi:TATA box-binding protein, partial [candidate division MSBL1 archaeon SCGC-AAA259J03]
MGVRIREMRDVYEGEVASLEIESGQTSYNPYQQTASEARVTLRTEEEKKTLRLGKSVASSLQSRRVSEGDVIQIDAETGRIMRLGQSREA